MARLVPVLGVSGAPLSAAVAVFACQLVPDLVMTRQLVLKRPA